MKPRQRIEIPGHWAQRDRYLEAIAKATGFQTVNRLLEHVAWEIASIRGKKNLPARFYRALSSFHEIANRKS